MATFGQRNGYAPIPQKMVPEAITEELRNSIWNLISAAISSTEYDKVTKILWSRIYKLPVDDRPYTGGYSHVSWEKSWNEVRRRVLQGKWYEVYDHIEFFAAYRGSLTHAFNQTLADEMAPYRLIDGKVCQVTEANEIKAIQEAMDHKDEFAPVALHIRTAIHQMSDRTNPDYRNSIKESISAIESAAKIITSDEKAELGKVLAILESKGKINGALKVGFKAIYGWTSDQQGIRHGMMAESNLSQDDAKFYVVICSAFVNYLKTIKIEK